MKKICCLVFCAALIALALLSSGCSDSPLPNAPSAQQAAFISYTAAPAVAAAAGGGSYPAGSYDLLTVKEDASEAPGLVLPAGDFGSAHLSPDASKISFDAYVVDRYHIFVMKSDGTGIQDLGPGIDPEWSPDGLKLVYADNGQIYTINPDGSGRTQITTGIDGWDELPSFSPDGTKIVFERDLDIYVMNANGSEAVNVTADAFYNSYPAYTLDGSMIVYTAMNDSGQADIVRMNANGTNKQPLTSTGDNLDPVFIGWHLMFISFRDGNFEVYTMAANGSVALRATNTTAQDVFTITNPYNVTAGQAQMSVNRRRR